MICWLSFVVARVFGFVAARKSLVDDIVLSMQSNRTSTYWLEYGSSPDSYIPPVSALNMSPSPRVDWLTGDPLGIEAKRKGVMETSSEFVGCEMVETGEAFALLTFVSCYGTNNWLLVQY